MGLSNDLSCEAVSLSLCCPNSHGCFQSEVSGFISPHWSPGLRGLLCSPANHPGLSVRDVGLQGLLVVRLPAPFIPHSTSLGRQSRSHHSNSSPLHPGCPSPPLLPVWMNVYFLFPWCQTSLPFDFLSVLVVRGGAVCLPTPPSWFSYICSFSVLIFDLLGV